ncbi:MAG TPA: indole-3-glycerol phosphate synthase TrpC [Solirubrobacteraceae bacterium]|jgi:indole-3-glycerol phosphate synthase|nr:indole-3-glycerol phosphate synthase TrpC [Solirubrobacteraceae bacterium]
MSVLADILASTRVELERRKRARPEAELRELALAVAAVGGAGRSLRDALNRPGIGVIAEFKRRSPSAGMLREGADLAEMASAYERGGADALSVLTEGPNFDGSLADLRTARAACGLPMLRKDFIVDPYQLYEALLAGADAVLLIVAALTPSELRALRELARGLNLDVLVESHDAAELRVALDGGADLIGINNRDLRDFSVDVERTFALLGEIPAGVTVVSESGITDSEQLARLEAAGVAAVLVGESLMRAPVPAEALRALRRRTHPALVTPPQRAAKSFS